MKISTLTNYTLDYKGYKILLNLKESIITDFVIINPNGEYLTSGDLYDDKHPNGIPDTKYFRKKIRMEIEELLENDVINIVNEMNEKE